MDPIFWLFGGLLLCVIGSATYFNFSEWTKSKKINSDIKIALTTIPQEAAFNLSAAVSPVTKRDGKRLRRKRKDDSAYTDGDNIWDDELFEDYTDFLWGSDYEVAENLVYEVMNPVKNSAGAEDIESAIRTTLESENDDAVSNDTSSPVEASNDVLEENDSSTDFDDLPDTIPNVVALSNDNSVEDTVDEPKQSKTNSSTRKSTDNSYSVSEPNEDSSVSSYAASTKQKDKISLD